MVEIAEKIFEDNMKDINFVHFVLCDLRDSFPEYFSRLEEFYHLDGKLILKKFDSSKEDLRKIEKDFTSLIDAVNKFNGDRRLVIKRTNNELMPRFNPSTIEILEKGTLEQKVEFFLHHIDQREKDNADNISNIAKIWESSSVKKFDADIKTVREKSIGFVKKGLLFITTKEQQK